MKGSVIGIDIGATRVKYVVLSRGRVIDKSVQTLDPDQHSEDGIIQVLSQKISQYNQAVAAIGVGVAGVIDREKGLIKESPNFPLWHDFNLSGRLSRVTGLPVEIDNDANMVALGEYAFGAGRGTRNMVLLTLGSGVGGGLILDGNLYHGYRGMAGEVGHITVEPEGFACNCGNRGCLEQYASATGLRNMVKRDAFFGDKTIQAVKDPNLPKRLYMMAKNGDLRAMEYFRSFGYYLAIGVGGLLNVLNPQLVVFAGGVAGSMDLWEADFRKELQGRAFASVLETVRIQQGELGDMAGAMGAARLAMR